MTWRAYVQASGNDLKSRMSFCKFEALPALGLGNKNLGEQHRGRDRRRQIFDTVRVTNCKTNRLPQYEITTSSCNHKTSEKQPLLKETLINLRRQSRRAENH